MLRGLGWVLSLLVLQRSDLAQSAQVSRSLTELGGEKGLYQVPRHRRPQNPATQAQNVHVIIFDPLLC